MGRRFQHRQNYRLFCVYGSWVKVCVNWLQNAWKRMRLKRTHQKQHSLFIIEVNRFVYFALISNKSCCAFYDFVGNRVSLCKGQAFFNRILLATFSEYRPKHRCGHTTAAMPTNDFPINKNVTKYMSGTHRRVGEYCCCCSLWCWCWCWFDKRLNKINIGTSQPTENQTINIL